MADDISLEIDRFDWTDDGRLELAGHWSGVRGMRFVRPTLNVASGDESHRLLAVLDHKPWPPDADVWRAEFPWTGDRIDVDSAELVVAPGVVVPLSGLGDPPAVTHAVPRPRTERPRRAEVVSPEPEPEPEPEAEPDEATLALEAAIREREQALRERDDAVLQRDEAQRERDAAVQQAAAREREAEAALTRERDAAIEERDAAVRERDQLRRARSAASKEQNALAEALRARDEAIVARDAMVVERDFAETQLAELRAERQAAPVMVMPEPVAAARRRRFRRQLADPAATPRAVHWSARVGAVAALLAAVVVVASFVF